jgi:hypothetical protein
MKADLLPYLALAHDPTIQWFKVQCRERLNDDDDDDDSGFV